MSHWGRARVYRAIIAPVALLLATLSFSTSIAGNLDDAFILLVYVRHFARSGSIYWNIEEGPVDGCTSILDMVFKAGLYKVLSGDLFALDWLVTFASLLIATLCVYWFTYALVRRFGELTSAGATVLSACAAFAMATNRASAEGAKMLLETPLFLLTVLVSVASLLLPRTFSLRARVWLGASWILVALARPEGLALVVMAAGYFVWTQRGRLAFSALALPIAIAATVLGSYWLWHIIRFGYWAPNTYYAKTSDSRWSEIHDGVNYVHSFVLVSPTWAIPALASVVLSPLLLLFSWRAPAKRAFLFLSGAALASLAAVIVSGGDLYWGLGRFLAPCTTLGLIALIVAGIGLRGRARLLAPTVMAMLTVGSLWCAHRSGEMRIWPRDTASGLGGRELYGVGHLRDLGVHTLAQTDYQRAKYYDDDLQVIDATGLNDKVAAHLPAPGQVLRGKGGIGYELSRQPDAISHGTQSQVSITPMANYTGWEITRDAVLVERYLNTLTPQWLHELEPLSRGYRATSYPTYSSRPEEDAPREGGISFMNVWLRDDIAVRIADPRVIVSPLTPNLVIALDSAALDGFSRVERDGDIPFRWTMGAARLDVPGTIGPNCQAVVTTWYGSLPFQVSWDHQPLSRVNDGPRWSLPSSALSTHVLEIASGTFAAGDRNVGVLVTGVGVICGLSR